MGERRNETDRGGRWFRYASALWATVKGNAMAGLKPGARAVWLALYAHADADTLTCDPSIETIGQVAGMNPKHATRYLTALEVAGLMERRRSKGGRERTEYRLIVPAVAPAQQQHGQRRNSSGRAGATPPVAPAQRQPLRQRNTNHDHQNQRQQTHAIEPRTDGGLRPGGGKGKLGHVEEADLADIGRLIALYCRWRRCPTPTAIDDALLYFAAAAIHALTVKPKNGKTIKSRPALFASIIRSGDYSKLTSATEDEARRRLNAHLHGTPAKRERPYDPLG